MRSIQSIRFSGSWNPIKGNPDMSTKVLILSSSGGGPAGMSRRFGRRNWG